MKRAITKMIVGLLAAHLLLGGGLLVIGAVHGINDQDASFAVVMLFRALNHPTVLALRAARANPTIPLVLLAGMAQWAVLGLAAGAAWHVMARGAKPSPEA